MSGRICGRNRGGAAEADGTEVIADCHPGSVDFNVMQEADLASPEHLAHANEREGAGDGAFPAEAELGRA